LNRFSGRKFKLRLNRIHFPLSVETDSTAGAVQTSCAGGFRLDS